MNLDKFLHKAEKAVNRIEAWYNDYLIHVRVSAALMGILLLFGLVSWGKERNMKAAPAMILEARSMMGKRWIVTDIHTLDIGSYYKEVTLVDCATGTIKTLKIFQLLPKSQDYLNVLSPGKIIEFEWSGREDEIITHPFLFLLLQPKVVGTTNYESAELNSPAFLFFAKMTFN